MSTAVAVEPWGPLVVGIDVDETALRVLERWMPAHLDHIVAERALELELAHPRQYETVLVDEELLDNKLPACVSETTRMEAAEGGTARVYAGVWQTRISVVVRGRHPAETRSVAALFEGAVRRVMLQHAGGEEPIDWIRYQGMDYEQVPGDQRRGRYLLKAVSRFQIRSDHIVDPFGGPPHGPPAELVDVDVQRVAPPASVTGGVR